MCEAPVGAPSSAGACVCFAGAGLSLPPLPPHPARQAREQQPGSPERSCPDTLRTRRRFQRLAQRRLRDVAVEEGDRLIRELGRELVDRQLAARSRCRSRSRPDRTEAGMVAGERLRAPPVSMSGSIAVALAEFQTPVAISEKTICLRLVRVDARDALVLRRAQPALARDVDLAWAFRRRCAVRSSGSPRPGGTVKSFSAVEKTSARSAGPGRRRGRPSCRGWPRSPSPGSRRCVHACPQSVTKRAPFDMPIPTSGVSASSPVVATRCACSLPRRARSGLVVSDGSADVPALVAGALGRGGRHEAVAARDQPVEHVGRLDPLGEARAAVASRGTGRPCRAGARARTRSPAKPSNVERCQLHGSA